MCYTLSQVLGKSLVVRCMPKRLVQFSNLIKAQRDNIFNYLLFLRNTPLLPNVFINVSSPMVGIPLKTFAGATFLGLMPLNIVHIRTGLVLSEVNSIGGFDFKQVIWLMLLGGVALIPTLLKSKAQKFIDKSAKEKKN